MVIKRILGSILVLLGLLGLAMCAAGIYFAWQVAADVTVAADDTLGLVLDTVANVQTTLDVASSTLDNAGSAVGGLYTTTMGVGDTVGSVRPAIEGMARLTETDLPGSIESTVAALGTMEETAVAIDGVLGILSGLGLAQYAPEVPLSEAVAEIGTGLERIPDDIRQLASSLRDTEASLAGVQSDLEMMGDQVLAIQDNVGSANTAIGGYSDVFGDLQSRLAGLRANVAQPIRTIAWALTAVLAWVGLSQLGFIHWGISLFSRRPAGSPIQSSAPGESVADSPVASGEQAVEDVDAAAESDA